MSDLSQVEKNKNLLIYVKNENINEIKNAIEHGADVNYTTPEGYTPLYKSIFTGNKEIVKTLIEAKAKIDVDGDEYNGPPLVTAARRGDVEIMKLLIEKGGNINIEHKKDRSFDTPLHVASKNKKDNAIEFLVDEGADLTIENNKYNNSNFKTPLDIIAEKYVQVHDKDIMKHQESVNIQEQQAKNVRILMEKVKNNQNKNYTLKQLESDLKSKQKYIDRSKGYLQDSIERKKKGMKFITSIIKKAFNKEIHIEQISTNPIVKEIYGKFKRVNKYRKDTAGKIEQLSEDNKKEINKYFGGKGGKRRRKTRKRKSNKKRRWSAKYKRSINCRRPKGFSQKQYCKYGRKTRRK